jgi:hypothetical protein
MLQGFLSRDRFIIRDRPIISILIRGRKCSNSHLGTFNLAFAEQNKGKQWLVVEVVVDSSPSGFCLYFHLQFKIMMRWRVSTMDLSSAFHAIKQTSFIANNVESSLWRLRPYIRVHTLISSALFHSRLYLPFLRIVKARLRRLPKKELYWWISEV